MLPTTLRGQQDRSAPREDGGSADGIARRIALGVRAGTIATLVMTAYRIPISGSLPPTAAFLAKLLGGDPDDHSIAGLALHLAYGAGGGVAFALLSTAFRGPDADVRGEAQGVLLGVIYGLLLSAFGVRALLKGLLDMDLAADERLVFHVSHVVYGLTLGTWLGSRLPDGG